MTNICFLFCLFFFLHILYFRILEVGGIASIKTHTDVLDRALFISPSQLKFLLLLPDMFTCSLMEFCLIYAYHNSVKLIISSLNEAPKEREINLLLCRLYTDTCRNVRMHVLACTVIQSMINIGFLCSLMHAGTASKRVLDFLPPTMLVVLLCELHIWLLTDTQKPPTSDLIVPKLFSPPALLSQWCVWWEAVFPLYFIMIFSCDDLFYFILMRSLAGRRDKPTLARFLLVWVRIQRSPTFCTITIV